MKTAKLTAYSDLPVGPVRRRTFGSFVEHLGRCVYGGIYDPESEYANEDGFRTDVIDLVKELGVSTVRYPGGNFVSGYRWEDGVGPVEERPRRLDLAWHTTEPNTVGTDEFMEWCKQANVEPMMAVNLGTRGVEAAVDLLEYCNHAEGTALSDARRENASDEPYDVRMWCLGNEMDGPWQTGHKTAEEYGRLAAETARAMRQMDPTLELVACGSSNIEMPTFGEWEYKVLEETYELVDYISAHQYYWEEDGDKESFLASAVGMDRFVKLVAATADAVKATRRGDSPVNWDLATDESSADKDLAISFDEWNVWYQKDEPSHPPTGDDWPVAPHLLEDNYNVLDAVVVGNLLISLLRNTDRVHAASLAQLVNVIAPIMCETDGRAWKQTTFHPFAQASGNAKGVVLETTLDSPSYETKKYGEVPVVDAVATHDEETGETVLFVVNRDLEDSVALDVDLRPAVSDVEVVSATSYHSEDLMWQASEEDDTAVLPEDNATAVAADGAVSVTLPPVSWNVIKVRSKN